MRNKNKNLSTQPVDIYNEILIFRIFIVRSLYLINDHDRV
jgi:hypothetical protein